MLNWWRDYRSWRIINRGISVMERIGGLERITKLARDREKDLRRRVPPLRLIVALRDLRRVTSLWLWCEFRAIRIWRVEFSEPEDWLMFFENRYPKEAKEIRAILLRHQ